ASLPPTPFTPSFTGAHAGSYNSPLGSDISYIPANEFRSPNPGAFHGDGFNDFNPIDIDVFPPEDYDPSAYDPPDNSALLFSSDFMASLSDLQQQHSSSPSLSSSSLGSNNPGVSVSVTPALDGLEPGMGAGAYGSPFDHESPASSNGDVDYQHPHYQRQTRSRASSVSSTHGANDYSSSATLGFERVRLETASPNPSWTKGPQSPPQLFIPGNMPEITHTSTSPQPSPTHSARSPSGDPNGNASILPSGDIRGNGGGGLMAPDGPGIHIVPATPISAGTGAGAAQGSPFHHNRQGVSLLLPMHAHAFYQVSSSATSSMSDAQTQSWVQSAQMMQQQQQQRIATPSLTQLPQAPPSQYSFPSPSAALTPPPTGGIENSSNMGALQLGLGDGGLGGLDNTNINRNGNDGNFLVPINQNPRSRSKSDTSARPPIWQMGVGAFGGDQVQGQNQAQDQTQGQGQFDDVFGSEASLYSQQLQQQRQQQHQEQMTRLSASHAAASFGPPASGSSGFNVDISNNGASGNNNFLSPDYEFRGGVSAADLRRVRSESHGHRRNALSADMKPIYLDAGNALHPPSSQQAFISRNLGNTFLTPGSGGLGGGMGRSVGISAGGAHRRSLSGGSGHGHAHSRSLSRERVSLSASPYPSPHASPRMNTNEQLPDIFSFPGSAGSDSGNIPVHVMGVDAQGRPTVQSQVPIQVVRQNVTTHATADASQRRRRTEANFQCPVPGCGSTFTRHFNLKGHLRSHNEERPFKCKWPGCDKGFARQHDCKRHEQLHLNIRPYTCQGCQRTFARMDALNRHLRSDAGMECQARQPILTNDTPNNLAISDVMQNGMADGLLSLKSDPDAGWQSPGPAGGVMV
ncbi:hypothetical protein EW145_g3580, partial [Phellinidium pouzarii]